MPEIEVDSSEITVESSFRRVFCASLEFFRIILVFALTKINFLKFKIKLVKIDNYQKTRRFFYNKLLTNFIISLIGIGKINFKIGKIFLKQNIFHL